MILGYVLIGIAVSVLYYVANKSRTEIAIIDLIANDNLAKRAVMRGAIWPLYVIAVVLMFIVTAVANLVEEVFK